MPNPKNIQSVSPFECAMICKDTYRPGIQDLDAVDLPIGWTFQQDMFDESNKYGLSARIYENSHKKTKIIAIRGTVPTKVGNLVADLEIFKLLVKADDQTSILKAMTQSILTPLDKITDELSHDYKLILTGHSLGGFLAELLMVYLECKGKNACSITFDSPGLPDEKAIKHLLDVDDLNKETLTRGLKNKMTTFLSPPNLVNTCHRHEFGQVFMLEIPGIRLHEKNKESEDVSISHHNKQEQNNSFSSVYTGSRLATACITSKMQASSASAMCVLSSLYKIVKSLAQIICEKNYHYHSLSNLCLAFNPETGFPWRNCLIITNWPTLSDSLRNDILSGTRALIVKTFNKIANFDVASDAIADIFQMASAQNSPLVEKKFQDVSKQLQLQTIEDKPTNIEHLMISTTFVAVMSIYTLKILYEEQAYGPIFITSLHFFCALIDLVSSKNRDYNFPKLVDKSRYLIFCNKELPVHKKFSLKEDDSDNAGTKANKVYTDLVLAKARHIVVQDEYTQSCTRHYTEKASNFLYTNKSHIHAVQIILLACVSQSTKIANNIFYTFVSISIMLLSIKHYKKRHQASNNQSYWLASQLATFSSKLDDPNEAVNTSLLSQYKDSRVSNPTSLIP